MNWPPMWMHVKFKNRQTDVGVWIPVLLLLLIAFAVVIVFLPLILLALIILFMVGMERWARVTLWSIWAAFFSIWAMKGLEVDVKGPQQEVIVSVS